MHLSQEEIKHFIPFKYELLRDYKYAKISDIPKDTYFWETENGGRDGYTGFLQEFKLNYNGHNKMCIVLDKRGCFTHRDDSHVEHINYCPAIYRQLSGKNKGKLFYFNFYEAWRLYSNSFEDIKKSFETEKRWFLPNYLPNYAK